MSLLNFTLVQFGWILCLFELKVEELAPGLDQLVRTNVYVKKLLSGYAFNLITQAGTEGWSAETKFVEIKHLGLVCNKRVAFDIQQVIRLKNNAYLQFCWQDVALSNDRVFW